MYVNPVVGVGYAIKYGKFLNQLEGIDGIGLIFIVQVGGS